jgi:hypothetical protein
MPSLSYATPRNIVFGQDYQYINVTSPVARIRGSTFIATAPLARGGSQLDNWSLKIETE